MLRHQPLSPESELAAALAAITEKNELHREFPPEVESAAAEAAANPPLPDRDLRGVEFVTIDPEESTDLDQALHIAEQGDGFRVRYAIADVPSFVVPGGPIDVEARKRGQTIYAPDGRIPLHPIVISENAASLLPDVERGAYVWDLQLSSEGRVTEARVGRARVRSRAKLSYEGVQRAMDAGTADPMLRLLERVGTLRSNLEQKRGGASLNLPDIEIENDGDGYRLARRRSLPVEGWNAQISLMTGMVAADMMLDAKIGILRTMPAPEPSAIEEFRLQTVALDCPWTQSQSYGDYLRTLDPSRPKQLAIMYAAASLFRGAGYTAFDGEVPDNPVQAAVAAPYAHTTAPLRRLVDRFVLVCCDSISNGRPVPNWVREALPQLPALMDASTNINGAVSRAAVDTVEAAVLSTHIGETFDAVVIGATNGGKGRIQLDQPAVTASCSGDLTVGEPVRARLTVAEIASATVAFEAV